MQIGLTLGHKAVNAMRKVDPNEYMVSGWDSAPPAPHPYKRGSLHNKVGMWIMWTYYVLFTAMFIRGLVVFLNK
jgi:hypothetical protein